MVVVTCFHPAPSVQVLANTVDVVPVVLSFNVAVAQSQVTSSGQLRLYQNDSCEAPDPAVKVWESFESPLVGLVEPSSAAGVPEWVGLDSIDVVPEGAQPVKSPFSKPPLTIVPSPPPLVVTVRV